MHKFLGVAVLAGAALAIPAVTRADVTLNSVRLAAKGTGDMLMQRPAPGR
jgi:hypothetical protein